MWAGPTQTTGQDPGTLGWAGLGPTDPFFGPGPATWVGPELARPKQLAN
jgi:hypothetical protein